MVVGGGRVSSVSKSVLRKRQRQASEIDDRKRSLLLLVGQPRSTGPMTPRPNHKPKSSNHSVADEVASLKKGSGPPGIVITLTKEEKEEDFLKMTGAKPPQKPMRRPRNVEKNLLYCFPGMFLSDVSSSKYDVVEEKKKSRKSKRRGLKGIVESSDSE